MEKAKATKAVAKKEEAMTTAVGMPITDSYLEGLSTLDVTVFDNLGGDKLSPFDLDRTKIPTGGALSWTIPSIEGEISAASFSGVVIEQRSVRTYFSKPYEGQTDPPECSSQDGLVGIGDPGGVCAECPYSEWGSSLKGGEGQACKQGRILFVLKHGNILPDIVTLPPTSIKPWRKYLQGLIKANLQLFAVETTFGLVKAQNKKGLAYSAVSPSMSAKLDPQTIAAVKVYRSKMKPLLETPVTLPHDSSVESEG